MTGAEVSNKRAQRTDDEVAASVYATQRMSWGRGVRKRGAISAKRERRQSRLSSSRGESLPE